jgi:hypothetical protein
LKQQVELDGICLVWINCSLWLSSLFLLSGCGGSGQVPNSYEYRPLARTEIALVPITAHDLLNVDSGLTRYVQVETCADSSRVCVTGEQVERLEYPKGNRGSFARFACGEVITMEWTGRNSNVYLVNNGSFYSTGIISYDSVRYYYVDSTFVARYFYWDRGSKTCFLVAGRQSPKFFYFENDSSGAGEFVLNLSRDSIVLIK